MLAIIGSVGILCPVAHNSNTFLIMQAITVCLVMFNKVKIQDAPVITGTQISLMLCIQCCIASLLHI